MTRLADLDRRLASVSSRLAVEVGEARARVTLIQEAQAKARAATELADATEKAIGVLSKYADARQAEVHSRVETLITQGLQTIFDDDLRFKVIQEVKARRVETRFAVVSTVNGVEVETDILNSRGGGVAAIVGFLLRLVVVLLSRDTRPFLFLDETFAQLSADREPALAEFLRVLVDQTQVQIVLVTHSEVYSGVADRVYQLSLKNGETTVRDLAGSPILEYANP